MDVQPANSLQNSVPLQNKLSSEQLASLATWSHESDVSLQESSVQPTVSLQFGGVPDTQTPSLQNSAPLQYNPSPHGLGQVTMSPHTENGYGVPSQASTPLSTSAIPTLELKFRSPGCNRVRDLRGSRAPSHLSTNLRTSEMDG